MSIRNGYHYNDDKQEYYLDEQGDKIPEQVCLCNAYEWSECSCDCTSWVAGEDYLDWDDLYETHS